MKTRWIVTLRRGQRPAVLRVRRGDVLLVQCDFPLAADQADRIKRSIEDKLGHRAPVLVTPGATRFSVIRPSPSAPGQADWVNAPPPEPVNAPIEQQPPTDYDG